MMCRLSRRRFIEEPHRGGEVGQIRKRLRVQLRRLQASHMKQFESRGANQARIASNELLFDSG